MDNLDLEVIEQLGLMGEYQKSCLEQIEQFANEVWLDIGGDGARNDRLKFKTSNGIPSVIELDGKPMANILPDKDKLWRDCVYSGAFKLEKLY